MCWNFEVSLAFGIWQCAVGIWFLTRTGYYYKWRVALYCFAFGFMELAEAFGWMWIEPLSHFREGKCNDKNFWASVAAYALIWIQPVTFPLAGLFNRKNYGGPQQFYMPLIMSVFTFSVAMWQLYAGETNPKAEISNIGVDWVSGNITCTYRGPNNYLLWKFKTHTLPNLPNIFTYMVLSCPIFFLRPLRHMLVGVFGFFGLMIISMYLFPDGSAESSAFWCGLTVILPFIYLIEYNLFGDNDGLELRPEWAAFFGLGGGKGGKSSSSTIPLITTTASSSSPKSKGGSKHQKGKKKIKQDDKH